MSKKFINKYTIIREYHNYYSLEETIRHIICHHIKNISIENLEKANQRKEENQK